MELTRDPDRLMKLGLRLARRYRGAPAGELTPEVLAGVKKQASKQIGLVFRPTCAPSWANSTAVA